MNNKFLNFVNSLKDDNNSILIECIEQGFKNIFESDVDELEEIIRWEQLPPEQKDRELIRSRPKKKPRKKVEREYPDLWRDAIAKVGKGHGIAPHAWPKVQAIYKNMLIERKSRL